MAAATLEFDVHMANDNCVKAVTQSLEKMEGIQSVKVDFAKQQVFVETTLPSNEVQEAIESTNRRAILKGMGSSTAGPQHMGAAVAAVEGPKGVFGVIRFLQMNEKVCLIDGMVDGLDPGQHGLHIHEYGDLTNGFSSMGGHYNPTRSSHGGPTHSERHSGDLGNIYTRADRRAAFRFENDELKVWDVIGRSVGVSQGADDCGMGGNERSKIDGNCGEGVAYGIIARSAGLFQNPKRICVCSGRTVWDERTAALNARDKSKI